MVTAIQLAITCPSFVGKVQGIRKIAVIRLYCIAGKMLLLVEDGTAEGKFATNIGVSYFPNQIGGVPMAVVIGPISMVVDAVAGSSLIKRR